MTDRVGETWPPADTRCDVCGSTDRLMSGATVTGDIDAILCWEHWWAIVDRMPVDRFREAVRDAPRNYL